MSVGRCSIPFVRRWARSLASLTFLAPALFALGASPPASASGTGGTVKAVAAENEYADVISQIGGRYVSVTAIMSNPNTDPHEFEASPSVAQAVSKAQLIVQNGCGYDSFMNKIEAAAGNSGRRVIVAQKVVGAPAAPFNPHLWYDPKTMPLVAEAIAADLAALQPAHKSYFQANEARFTQSLRPWLSAVAKFRSRYPGTPVAVTEPVADYMLQAAGAEILTPEALQSAIMNGTDPSPQDITLEGNLLSQHRVKVFLYNRQVTDSLTADFSGLAKKAHVPVVGVYETMPLGYHYQSWMMAEMQALQLAVSKGVSTQEL
ncbi:MAG TPA: zinc ABC transporter substrate-binding protein [Acidimicrobiales bacterium]|nr:zinc ABC transporter substrate-binding protein [Acidimicrobiales bacterium]